MRACFRKTEIRVVFMYYLTLNECRAFAVINVVDCAGGSRRCARSSAARSRCVDAPPQRSARLRSNRGCARCRGSSRRTNGDRRSCPRSATGNTSTAHTAAIREESERECHRMHNGRICGEAQAMAPHSHRKAHRRSQLSAASHARRSRRTGR